MEGGRELERIERGGERKRERQREIKRGKPIPQLSGLQIWLTDSSTLRQKMLQRHPLEIRAAVAEGNT